MKKLIILSLTMMIMVAALLLPIWQTNRSLFANVNQEFLVYLPIGINRPTLLGVVPYASGLEQPYVTDIVDPGDGRLFVALRDGRIQVINTNAEVESGNLLDITDRIFANQFEAGLLGLAPHPNFSQNGYLYTSFTRTIDSELVMDVARFLVSPTGEINPESEKTILRLQQHEAVHQGGALQFGPLDDYLYIATGDGGSPYDKAGNAQSGQSLLGKILRIDVDRGSPYNIPEDNPFADDTNVRDEIWAFGLRNPWRISFDNKTGDMYIGDVGHASWEEINFLPAGSNGGANFGWPCYEGPDVFEPKDCGTPDQYTKPIFTYIHDQDPFHCAVIGGYVYRGTQVPELEGHYLFADYCGTTIWTLTQDGTSGWTVRQWGQYKNSWSTFGERSDGELFLGTTGNDTIFQISWADFN